MPKMHLRQPRFTYSTCGLFTRNKERIQKFKRTGDSQYIYQNELHKGCFQYDMAYGEFKDLTRRTASDKILRDKTFNIAKNAKYDGYQRGLASMVYKIFNKKSSGRATMLAWSETFWSETLATRATLNKSAIKYENISNKELVEELNKPIVRKFEKWKVHSPFIDNNWGFDLNK